MGVELAGPAARSPVGHVSTRVCKGREALRELCPSLLEVADQHQRLAEAVVGLEHEAGLVGRELEQDTAGLAEVDRLVRLAVHHRRGPKARGVDSGAPALLLAGPGRA